ncbi:MAG: hypothetical protein A4E28_01304 [Methanocella sp. PtaU1.Bin125]|nr:MAG: hypothetical protein A4E28_01304 [Methanocella sp. PtaU1.Bin125]
MEQTQAIKTIPVDENVSVSVNYCVNTNRTYVYELKNGDIVSEKTIHGV